MLRRIANWHGERAADAYVAWTIFNNPEDLALYCYHILKADKLWR